ncbi:MAG: glycoside hydrolase family 99-like domain-containing protein [Clostridia bacterium]|nr:glycoside hydrolase family 99-like domain-containing protein [Clostridia bacterium]
MRTIAFYLPQFHAIPENDAWWGEGFTEWVNVKKAEPLFEGHNQPRVPLGENYYNLIDPEVMKWQVSLAKEYGVYGFCFYHYWFDGHMLLEKPVDQYLAHREMDLPFCICWANEHWTNAWVSGEQKVLIEQRYGGKKEWEEHFNYLLPFFKDDRYICNDGKPLVVIYRAEIIDCLNEMLDYWQELAKSHGFPGLDFAYQHISFDLQENRDDSRFSYNIEYQPAYAINDLNNSGYKLLRDIKRKLVDRLDLIGFKLMEKHPNNIFTKGYKVLWDGVRNIHPQGLIKQSYDEMWNAVLNHIPESEKCIPGAFVDWDNTPRHSMRGRVFIDACPEKFEKYMKQQILRAKKVYHKDMLFLFAWNEWAEGGYMEPDEKFGYGYLEALRNALIATNEMP